MNIALIGYGKMGKEIEQIAINRGHQIGLIIDVDNHAELNETSAKQIDVAIDFSTPHSVIANIHQCLNLNVPLVIGTTGWYNELDSITTTCKEKNGSLFHSTNYSIGVNLFFEVNRHMAKLFKKYPQYQLAIEEIHHTQKLDSPSGTAITTAEGILESRPDLNNWTNQLIKSNQIPSSVANNELLIVSKREENVPGTHTVSYFNDVDRIDLTHTAHNRKGFAEGAVIAAEFLAGKKGIFTMKDLLGF